jgi:flagellar export protein FliJ
MAYQSRLSAVILMRTLQEEEAHREWAGAKGLLAQEQERLNQLGKKLQITLTALTDLQKGFVAADEVTLYFDFIENLREGIKHQKKIVAHQEAVCEEKRVLLDMAVKERKVVETVEERRKRAYFNQIFKKEQTVLDEISGQLKLRDLVDHG